MDKMREEFEKWYDEVSDNNGGVAHYVEIDGKYCFNDIQWLYDAWQASRAALVVELPKLIIDEYKDGTSLYYFEDNDIKMALSEIGIKYE